MVLMPDHRFDISIIGGGIVGVATAMQLATRFPRRRIAVLEKEERLAAHQTGHNSGVIHSGIYYLPGSLKARTCVEGARRLLEFCEESGVAYELCGKVVIATDETESARLRELYRRGTENGVPGLEMIGPERLREIEPHARGVMALSSPNTGIIDFADVTGAYARRFQEQGGEVLTSMKVLSIRQAAGAVVLDTVRGSVQSSYLINCGGLHSDTVARAAGVALDVRIIPFRGEYHKLAPDARSLVNGLIYPVPDPAFPFLGAHFTKTIHGAVEAGPNAVLAFAREGYTRSSVHVGDMMGAARFPGFWKMSARYWKMAVQEIYQSLSKGAFARALQRLVPAIQERDLERGGAGVRAQAVDRNGSLIDDFRIVEAERSIHVLNAPSPGATASLAIADSIAGMAERSFGLTG